MTKRLLENITAIAKEAAECIPESDSGRGYNECSGGYELVSYDDYLVDGNILTLHVELSKFFCAEDPKANTWHADCMVGTDIMSLISFSESRIAEDHNPKELAKLLKSITNSVSAEEIERELTEQGYSWTRPELFKATNIKWDTDGKKVSGLPTECVVDFGVDEDGVADWLSDKYGFCIEGFCLEPA